MLRNVYAIIIAVVISSPLYAYPAIDSSANEMALRSMSIQQKFYDDVEKLFDFTTKQLAVKFHAVWIRNNEVFDWANYHTNINSNNLDSLGLQSTTGNFIATGAFVLEDGSFAMGGYFEKIGKPIIIATKAFQFKAKTLRVTHFDTKYLRTFISRFSSLHSQRDKKLKQIAKEILLAENNQELYDDNYYEIRKSAMPGTVNAISIQDQGSSVMINNRLYGVDGVVCGIKIVCIEPNRVTFDKNGIRWSQSVGAHPSKMWHAE